MSATWSSFGQARTIGPRRVQEVVGGIGLAMTVPYLSCRAGISLTYERVSLRS